MTRDVRRPDVRPADPRFSSGPCKKRPGWSPSALDTQALGRSHRSSLGKARIQEAIAKTRQVLQVPDSHKIAITPASDTGAVEMALWTLLGARPVDVLAWESFGLDWVKDVTDQLKLPDCRVLEAGYGEIADLSAVRVDADVVFTWNGTTSGVRVPDAQWISPDREGLTICDATSAAFAQALDWAKLDVVTLSFQKALGGEGQHGVLIMNERALARVAAYDPPWPIPKIFRFKKKGVADAEFFEGSTLNTPSMLVVEDWIDALDWSASIGGLPALIGRADANLSALAEWVARTDWVDFLAQDAATRSNTSVCLSIVDPKVSQLPEGEQSTIAKGIAKLLEAEGVALDIGGYRAAPPGLRVWCGATVETGDIEALTPWLDWAFASVMAERAAV